MARSSRGPEGGEPAGAARGDARCDANGGSGRPAADVAIQSEPASGGFEAGWVASKLAAAAANVPAWFGAIRVRVVGDPTMAALHGRHCGDPTTTDVLTFATPGDEGRIDVDVVLCLDEAVRQSRLRGHSTEQELLLYALHALLHCAGHDDHDEPGWAAMHAEEDRILEAIGVGATFGRGGVL